MTTRKVPGGRRRLPSGKRASNRWLGRRTFRSQDGRGPCSTKAWADDIHMTTKVRRFRARSFEHGRRVSMFLHEHARNMPAYLERNTEFVTRDEWGKFGGETAFVITRCTKQGLTTVLCFASDAEAD